jgi:L-lactate dehydrogenase complex protein LldG
MNTPNRQNIFTEKATAVSAIVQPVADIEEALDYAVNFCQGRQGQKADGPTLAAPALSEADFKKLLERCEASGVRLIDGDLRSHLSGVDVGLTYADFGIAETGTLVIDSTSEDLRLATMISDAHLAILPVSKIRADSLAVAEELRSFMTTPNNFTAFITGASRTADIERVLAIGVHGPLELHILLLEDAQC